jgi:Rieske Fe-S protein
VGREFVEDRRNAFGARDVTTLGTGDGGICRRHGRAVAAYRDGGGNLHVMSPRCPHLKCFVAWNPLAKTWECPCHGSVFDAEGRMIHGPAVRDMRRLE